MLEVQVLEAIENEIKDPDLMLSMLLPNQLKKGTMQFLEVEDIKTVAPVMPPSSKSKPVDTMSSNYEEDLSHEEVLMRDL